MWAFANWQNDFLLLGMIFSKNSPVFKIIWLLPVFPANLIPRLKNNFHRHTHQVPYKLRGGLCLWSASPHGLAHYQRQRALSLPQLPKGQSVLGISRLHITSHSTEIWLQVTIPWALLCEGCQWHVVDWGPFFKISPRETMCPLNTSLPWHASLAVCSHLRLRVLGTPASFLSP